MTQFNYLAEDTRLNKLSKLGDPLERLKRIDWESFRPLLQAALIKADRKSNAGRPPYDCVMLFKVLILQRLYNISDDQTEFQINDRMSFSRFLGLSLSDKVPDAKTIWLFRETLSKTDAIKECFNLFNQKLESEGIITHEGTIVDATFTDAPRQRNHHDENKQIKEGKVPEEWKKDTPEAAHKLAQKDTDARWTEKNGEKHYGYKDHVKVDSDSKIIEEYAVTSAEVHDSRKFTEFINKNDKKVYADSAYAGKELSDKLPKNIENCVHEKGYRDHPLTEEQKNRNKEKSKIRSRIEHVFGYMTGSFRGITVRSIGITRATFSIGLMNLMYNMFRYDIIEKQKTKSTTTCMG